VVTSPRSGRLPTREAGAEPQAGAALVATYGRRDVSREVGGVCATVPCPATERVQN